MAEAVNIVFRGGRLCLPGGEIRAGDLHVENGRIVEIGPKLDISDHAEIVNVDGLYLAPGFVDLHVHGALGHDAMDATSEACEAICRYHVTGGTTTLALTSICASWHDIGRALDVVRDWRESSGVTGARLAGMHVEGPYFSPHRRGAHRAEFLREPAPDDIDHWVRYADVITQITLAPELPGMRELIPALVAAGIRVSGGHSDAWDEDAQAAFAEGMRQVTHTFNCMSSCRRRGPYRVAGLLEAALAHPEVVCEVIADGKHVSPTLLRMLWNAKGAARVALITDATAGAGLQCGAEFLLGNIRCRVDDGVALTEDGQALAGSTCRMIDGVRTLVRDVGIPLGEAVVSASATPARQLGLKSECGELRPGLRADIVLFDEDFQVRQTWVSGGRVFQA